MSKSLQYYGCFFCRRVHTQSHGPPRSHDCINPTSRHSPIWVLRANNVVAIASIYSLNPCVPWRQLHITKRGRGLESTKCCSNPLQFHAPREEDPTRTHTNCVKSFYQRCPYTLMKVQQTHSKGMNWGHSCFVVLVFLFR
jgi:hypothetical protein